MYAFIYVCLSVTIITKEKEAKDLKGWSEWEVRG